MAEQTRTLRVDNDGYVENYTIAAAISLGFLKNNWLIPGVTYTSHETVDAGDIDIPVYTKKKNGGATALCVDGNPGDAQGEYLPLRIDRKVTAKFDGCFTVTGIADKLWEMNINKTKFKVLAEDQMNEISADITEDDTTFTTTKTDAYDIIVECATNYLEKNGMYPEVALVSPTFALKIKTEAIHLLIPAVGERMYVRGQIGTIDGILIITRIGQTEDLILMVPEALHIVTPTTMKDVPPRARILGSVDAAAGAGFGFALGMASFWEIKAQAGIAWTWVHKYFGSLIIPGLMIKTTVGGDTPRKAPKSTSK